MKKLQVFSLMIVVLLISSVVCGLQVNQAEAASTAVFRPVYTGMVQGTRGPYVTSPTTPVEIGPIDREINLEAWDVSKLGLTLTIALPDLFIITELNYSDPRMSVILFPIIRFKVSTDKGATYPYEWLDPSVHIRATRSIPGGFTGFTSTYYVPTEYIGYFGPDTRVKLEFIGVVLPYFYLPVWYINETQRPVPPYDLIGSQGEYIQYDMYFTAEYTPKSYEYVGETVDFSGYSETKEKLRLAGDMILKTQYLSGASNEVTDKRFGTDSFIVIYSSQLAFMELLKLRSVIDDDRYIPAARRFIVWMWSKQNQTDGSFPFILTDGDLHPWYNVTTDSWYGRDKIDSFSACAISLMRAYYDATGDKAFVDRYWYQIVAAKTFVWDLIDATYGIPVDGYHYTSATEYYKSTWNWLHDSVEAVQGFYDFAYLTGMRGDTEGETYMSTWADTIAGNIRTHFWNESLGRYSGMFNVDSGSQDTVLVYNIITPLIYGLETNVTRAVSTLTAYINWGILSGRYLNYKWAEDYEVTNEYSTMSGMIYAGYAQLIRQFNVSDTWMKDSYIEVSKFLFNNPVYPERNLQKSTGDNQGFLDWVDLVNHRYAWEYARLIETSAWFINGWIQTPNMTSIFRYSKTELLALNASLTNDQAFWDLKYAEFRAETGHNYNSEGYYDDWVAWTQAQGIYVAWYDFQFLKYLYEEGYLDGGWRGELDDDVEDLNETITEILTLQDGGLNASELDPLLLLLQNVTLELAEIQAIINEHATTEQKATFQSYFDNITSKVNTLAYRINLAKMDGSVTEAEIDGIEEVKIPLIAELQSLRDFLKSIVDVPWWEEWTPDDDPDWIEDVVIVVADPVGDWFMVGVGLLGVAFIVGSPAVIAWSITSRGLENSLGIIFLGFATFVIGIGLVIIWILPGG